MARELDVQKFGGTDHLGSTKLDGYDHEIESIETESKTKLEDDTGVGNAAIIRMFEFTANLESFKQHQPSKQELFDSHKKGIEIALWRDGLKVIPEVEPRVVFSDKTHKYRIFIGAAPMKGHILQAQTRTLKELAHG